MEVLAAVLSSTLCIQVSILEWLTSLFRRLTQSSLRPFCSPSLLFKFQLPNRSDRRRTFRNPGSSPSARRFRRALLRFSPNSSLNTGRPS